MSGAEYTDTLILEANRLHSPEYTQSDNTSIWSNALSDGVRLDIGDKVSLHSAFISDLGAEDSTIEFKGNIIQDVQNFIVSDVENFTTKTYDNTINNASNLHPRYYLTSAISASEIEIRNIRDTDANVLISFYKTNNGENMFHMPIRWALPRAGDENPEDSWKKVRENGSTGALGLPVAVSASHRYADDYNWDSTNKLSQLNVDGSRFMIFGRDQTEYIQQTSSTSGTIAKILTRRDLFGTTRKYIRIRELLQLQAPKGFNTPSEISSVITDSLQRETPVTQNTYNYLNDDGVLIKRQLGPQNETPTNKLFPCATQSNLNASVSQAYYGTVGGTTIGLGQESYDHEVGFQYIGIKRPELYESGVDIKEIYRDGFYFSSPFLDCENIYRYISSPTSTYLFSIGPELIADVQASNGLMENMNTINYDYVNDLPFGMVGVDETTPLLSVIYTSYIWNETNLKIFKEFFDNQSRYPELFSMDNDRNELLYNKNINGSDIYAGDNITVDTHRFLHLNNYTNASQPRELVLNNVDGSVEDDAGSPVSFGYDNIPTLFSSINGSNGFPVTAGKDFSSVPFFVKYYKDRAGDTTTTDIPYTYDTDSGAGLWGGFAVRTPPSLIPTDTGTETTLTRDNNVSSKRSGLQDRIAFLAHVPKQYLHPVTLPTFHNSDGSASTTIQNHSIYTMGKIDWYTDFLSATVYPPPLNHSGENEWNVTFDTVKIGYDSHPTAYGNAYIGLYNGICGEKGNSFDNEYEVAVDRNNPLTYYATDGSDLLVNPTPEYISPWINKIYCGAIEPELSFDSTTSRFALSSLHSPERITARYDATLVKTGIGGSSASLNEGQVIPVPDNNGDECYKLNKIFDKRDFCPTLIPYFRDIGVDITGTTKNDLFAYPYLNQLVKNNSIIESQSGIFIEDLNILEKNWSNSFWSILGFSYENLNIDNTGNINERVFDNNLGNISKITTNAQVNNSDLLDWRATMTGVTANKYMTPYPTIIKLQHTTGHTATKLVSRPPVEVLCSSVKIEARNLPTKTLRPYFVIRSDIISDAYFNGGKNEPSVMPVLEVMAKEGTYGDYYYSAGTTEFTVTFPRTITNVTTLICDPSGQPSNLSPNSAVLYKITKSKTLNNNIMQQVMQANQKK